jgi:predicted DNA-binding transcriptional regulator AlpA
LAPKLKAEFAQREHAPAPKLIDYVDLVAKGIEASPVTLWRWQRDPKIKFPRRIKISHHKIKWAEAEVDAWLAARIAARQPVAA